MSVLTDLIYGGSNAVAGLTEGAVNDAIAKYGVDKEIAFPDTAYYFPTIYAATGVKVKTLGDLLPCVGVLKSLITGQEDLGQALNAGLATAVGAEIIEGLKWVANDSPYENDSGIGFVPDPIIRSLGVPLVTGDIPGVAVVLGKAENAADVVSVVKDNGHTGDIAGDQGDTQGADDGVGNEADSGLILVGIAALNILQAFDNFSTDSGGKTGIQGLTQIFLIGDQALQDAHTGDQVPQGLDLDTGGRIDGGEIISGIGECDGLIRAVLCDGIVDCAFGQTGNCITACIDQVG